MEQLHILNGDSIYEAFIAQPIPQSEVAVWREVLAEGPVHHAVGTPEFWNERANFFPTFFEVSASEYTFKALNEFEKIRRYAKYQSITLWFEYDWFCQINLMGLLAYFAAQEGPKPRISLVCIGELTGYEGLVALGEIDSSLFPQLYQERMLLSRTALSIAAQFWDAYTAGRPEELVPIARAGRSYFPYLEAAAEAHLRNYPELRSGLGAIQRQLLTTIAEGTEALRPLIGQALRADQYYGYGDLQYQHYLKGLQSLLQPGLPLQLNEHGKAVLAASADFQANGAPEYHYGGTSTKQIRWDAQLHQIVRL
ncbi:MAG: hypothetical protein AAF798_02495 [Bacteroidota bacterium]